MEGFIEEGKDAFEKDEEGASFDSGIIGAALRTKHYEIAGYTAAIAMSKVLGLDITGLLTDTLNEETIAAEKILAAGQPILEAAAEEPEEEESPKTGKEKYSEKKSKEDEKNAGPALRRRAS